MGKRNVILLGVTSFLVDISSEIANPIIPIFISLIKGDYLCLAIFSSLSGFAEIIKLFSGYLSDKVNKCKAIVISGYLTSAISKFLFPFSPSCNFLLLFKGLERFGKGLRDPPRDKLIVLLSTQEERAFYFSIHRTLDTLGALLGSLLAYLLIAKFDPRKILLLSALIALTSLAPLIFVKEVKSKTRTRKLRISKAGIKFILITFLFSLSNINIVLLLGIFKGKEIITLSYFLFNLSYVIFSIPFAKLSDALGKKKILIFSYLLYSASFSFFLFNFHPFLIFPIIGMAYSIFEVNQKAIISKEKAKGLSLGMLNFSKGIAKILSSLIFGVIYSSFGSLSFLFPISLSLFSAILLSLI